MSSSVITQQSSGLATETQSGLVSTGTQSFAGVKTLVNGISFGNEVLKNYDEGTWTPRLTGGNGGVYTMGGLNAGRYTRIGNTVTVWATIQWTAVTTAYTGNLIIADLPFTCGDIRCAGSLCAPSGSSITQANAIFGTLIDPGYNFAYIIANTVGGSYSHTPSVASSGVIYGFTITYRIA